MQQREQLAAIDSPQKLINMIEIGDVEGVRDLLLRHPDWAVTPVNKQYPMQLAIIKGHSTIVELLYRAGNSVFEHDYYALLAAEHDRCEILAFMARMKPDSLIKEDRNRYETRTAAHVAAMHGCVEALRFLLSQRPATFINPQRYRLSVAHIAARYGQVRVLRFLKQYDASLLTCLSISRNFTLFGIEYQSNRPCLTPALDVVGRIGRAGYDQPKQLSALRYLIEHHPADARRISQYITTYSVMSGNKDGIMIAQLIYYVMQGNPDPVQAAIDCKHYVDRFVSPYGREVLGFSGPVEFAEPCLSLHDLKQLHRQICETLSKLEKTGSADAKQRLSTKLNREILWLTDQVIRVRKMFGTAFGEFYTFHQLQLRCAVEAGNFQFGMKVLSGFRELPVDLQSTVLRLGSALLDTAASEKDPEQRLAFYHQAYVCFVKAGEKAAYLRLRCESGEHLCSEEEFSARVVGLYNDHFEKVLSFANKQCAYRARQLPKLIAAIEQSKTELLEKPAESFVRAELLVHQLMQLGDCCQALDQVRVMEVVRAKALQVATLLEGVTACRDLVSTANMSIRT